MGLTKLTCVRQLDDDSTFYHQMKETETCLKHETFFLFSTLEWISEKQIFNSYLQIWYNFINLLILGNTHTHTHSQYIGLFKLMLHIDKTPKSAIKPKHLVNIIVYILKHNSHIQVGPLGVGVPMLVLYRCLNGIERDE